MRNCYQCDMYTDCIEKLDFSISQQTSSSNVSQTIGTEQRVNTSSSFIGRY